MKMMITGPRFSDIEKIFPKPSAHMDKPWIVQKAKQAVSSFVLGNRPDLLLCPTHPGIDHYVMELAKEAGIPYIAVISFKDRSMVWPQKIQRKFNKLLREAERVVYVDREPGSDYISRRVLPDVYHKSKIFRDLTWCIDHLDANEDRYVHIMLPDKIFSKDDHIMSKVRKKSGWELILYHIPSSRWIPARSGDSVTLFEDDVPF